MLNYRLVLFALLLSADLRSQDCSNLLPNIEPIEEIETAISRHFVTDLCTGYKEGTKKQPQKWLQCCVWHDLRLWAGGAKAHRRVVDRLLRQCVKEKGGKSHALIMWLGIRLGSLSPIKLPGIQWGNAWGNKSRRKPLTEVEIINLKKSLQDHPSMLSKDEIDQFINELYINNL
jgi:hypothetical protein